jgi:hypothetical protein
MYREVAVENAERGASLLDRLCPGWDGLIDLDELDVDDPGRCVLGQLYGGYDEGLFEIDMEAVDMAPRVAHGFTLDSPDAAKMGDLTAAWRRLIEERRGVTHGS